MLILILEKYEQVKEIVLPVTEGALQTRKATQEDVDAGRAAAVGEDIRTDEAQYVADTGKDMTMEQLITGAGDEGGYELNTAQLNQALTTLSDELKEETYKLIEKRMQAYTNSYERVKTYKNTTILLT